VSPKLLGGGGEVSPKLLGGGEVSPKLLGGGGEVSLGWRAAAVRSGGTMAARWWMDLVGRARTGFDATLRAPPRLWLR
jgi:hypothetical protein